MRSLGREADTAARSRNCKQMGRHVPSGQARAPLEAGHRTTAAGLVPRLAGAEILDTVCK
jgi:hypothetical protein